MANINNTNYHNIKLIVNNDEYWDFFLSKDSNALYVSDFNGNSLYDKCLISYIDAENELCISGENLYSMSGYSWEDAVVTEDTLYNVGYTAFDNGLLYFDRSRILNSEFLKLYRDSIYDLPSSDTRLMLHQVKGCLNLYDYPVTVEEDKIKLNGGFYQGFFETKCSQYDVLPSKLENGDTWEFEFVLNKQEFEKESDKTLNDKYPNNKGIFFYLGTRAENKWIYLYDDVNQDDSGSCDAWDIRDYVEDADIDKWKYGINNFTADLNPEFWVDDDYPQEIVINNYINNKYYSPEYYKDKPLEEDDFFDVDFDGHKPNIIDEDNLPYIILKKCGTCEQSKCGCAVEDLDTLSGKDCIERDYVSSCEFFGEDFLLDVDEMEYEVDFVESDIDISYFEFQTSKGLDIRNNRMYYVESDNKFLMFDRTCSGFRTWNWEDGSTVRYFIHKTKFKGNLFLLMNRTCTGYTVNNIDELRYSDENTYKYNIYKDLYDNALAFRIKDDGSIGYRYITLNCSSDTQIEVVEGYSKPNIITENEWHEVHVKLEVNNGQMQLRFYVDGYLIFISKWLDKLNLRALYEDENKQETVPYNLSLGGGTQGLAETVLPNYMLDPYRVYPLEENFGGSFIGYISKFRFFNCSAEYINIKNNFLYDLNK